MRLTVVGCSGSYPGPDSPASCYLLEADDDGRAAPGGCCSTSAAARSARCTGTSTRSRSTPCCSATCTPTTASTCAGYYVLRKYHPDGAAAADPGLGSGRHRRPDGPRLRPAARPGHDTRSSTSASGPAPIDDRPVHGDAGRRSTTRCRPSACGSAADGATLAYTGDTGPCAALDEVAADADLFLAEASFRSGDDNPPDLHLTGADVRRRRRPAAAPGSWCSPTCRRGTTRRSRWPRPRSTYDGPWRWPGPGAVYEV